MSVEVPARPASVPSGYYRRGSLAVTKDPTGVDGAVELLEDARIRREQLKPEQRLGGDPCAPVGGAPSPAFCENVKALRFARVRLVSSDGVELSTLTLERPLASVEMVHLRTDVPSYQVTVDLTAEFGSYSGPSTRFAEVTNGKLQWLSAIEVQSGKPVPVAVATTLKTEWNLSPTASGAKEILQIDCRPDFDASPPDADLAFAVTLSRFAFEGDRWQRHTRSKRGCWEVDDAFPTRALFP